MNPRIFNSLIEGLESHEMSRLQERLLRRVLEQALDSSDFWRSRLKAAGITDVSSVTLESYRGLAPVTKEDFLADQESTPPLGQEADRSD
jgi:phenylacetate-coenzyme A ligase PaaK-like adenylate-forming protein